MWDAFIQPNIVLLEKTKTKCKKNCCCWCCLMKTIGLLHMLPWLLYISRQLHISSLYNHFFRYFQYKNASVENRQAKQLCFISLASTQIKLDPWQVIRLQAKGKNLMDICVDVICTHTHTIHNNNNIIRIPPFVHFIGTGTKMEEKVNNKYNI